MSEVRETYPCSRCGREVILGLEIPRDNIPLMQMYADEHCEFCAAVRAEEETKAKAAEDRAEQLSTAQDFVTAVVDGQMLDVEPERRATVRRQVTELCEAVYDGHARKASLAVGDCHAFGIKLTSKGRLVVDYTYKDKRSREA